ncbi:MAG: ATP-dependent Clp protease adaptor ClpS [Prosthecobacter sp.]|nr:ATP-dependent Clp protease adaptor ClpS [Prosthecobacter sp.]
MTPSNASAAPVKPAGPRIAPVQPEREPELEPPYHVILYDDNDHTYRYVVEMIVAIFCYEEARAFLMACEVDANGRVILATVHKELAELRVEQIHEFGADPYSKNSKGSMSASMEPAE